jgi:hypothetical protein
MEGKKSKSCFNREIHHSLQAVMPQYGDCSMQLCCPVTPLSKHPIFTDSVLRKFNLNFFRDFDNAESYKIKK